MNCAGIFGIGIALVACQQEGADIASLTSTAQEADACGEPGPQVECNCGVLSATIMPDGCGPDCSCDVQECELAGCEAMQFCNGLQCTECTCQPSVIAQGAGRAQSLFWGDDGELYVELTQDLHRIDAQGVGVPVAPGSGRFVRDADGTLITFGSSIVDLDSRRTVVEVVRHSPSGEQDQFLWEPAERSNPTFVGASAFSDGSIRVTYSRDGVLGQAKLVGRDLEIVAENELGTFDGVDSVLPQLRQYFKLPDDRVYVAGFLGAYGAEEAVHVAALSADGTLAGQHANRIGGGANAHLAVAPGGNVYLGWRGNSSSAQPSHLQVFDTNMELLWQDHDAGNYHVAGFDSSFVAVESVPQVVRQTAGSNLGNPALQIVRTTLDGSTVAKSLEHDATQLLREGDDAVLMLVNSNVGDRYEVRRYRLSWFDE